MSKFNCLKCKFCENELDSCYSCCNHPIFLKMKNNPIINIIKKNNGGIKLKDKNVKITLNEDGIKKGECLHPFKFYPKHILDCNLYINKDGE